MELILPRSEAGIYHSWFARASLILIADTDIMMIEISTKPDSLLYIYWEAVKRSNTGQNTNTQHTSCVTNALRKTEYINRQCQSRSFAGINIPLPASVY